MKDEEMKTFASQLRAEGIDAHEWGESIEEHILIGIIVKGLGFFPLWELNEPASQALLVARDFAGIKDKRDRMWEPVEPHLRKSLRRKN